MCVPIFCNQDCTMALCSAPLLFTIIVVNKGGDILFFNELKFLAKSKSRLILSILSILMSLIFCYLYLMDYSTVIYYGNNDSEIFYGLEAYEKQELVEKNRTHRFLDENLVEEIVNNIIELNKLEKDEEKEQFYRMISPYQQGEYIVKRLNIDSGGKIFNRHSKSKRFYELRNDIINKKIRNLCYGKQKLFKHLNAKIKIPFRYGKMNGWPEMLSNLSMLGLLLISILGIASSTSFSKLYENESDEIILSTKNGRKNMVKNKILVQVIWNIVVSIICIALYLLISFRYIKLSGGDSSIQMIGLYSPYNLTLMSVLLILIVFILLGVINSTVLANFISIDSKNSIISIGIYLIIILVHIVQTYYLKDINVGVIKLVRTGLSFLPMSSTDIYYELLGFRALKLMNLVIPFYYAKIGVYLMGTVILFFLCKRRVNKLGGFR